MAAPESATPKNQETLTEGSHTQRTEQAAPLKDPLDKKLQTAKKQMEYLKIQ